MLGLRTAEPARWLVRTGRPRGRRRLGRWYAHAGQFAQVGRRCLPTMHREVHSRALIRGDLLPLLPLLTALNHGPGPTT